MEVLIAIRSVGRRRRVAKLGGLKQPKVDLRALHDEL
jgi:hypothetical protein